MGFKGARVAAVTCQVTSTVQARDDNGLNESRSRGGSQIRQESGHVLKGGLIGLAG